MSKTINARFTNGVLTPLETLDLPEGALVALSIETSHPPESAVSVNYNRLNEDLLIEEYLGKERKFREREE